MLRRSTSPRLEQPWKDASPIDVRDLGNPTSVKLLQHLKAQARIRGRPSGSLASVRFEQMEKAPSPNS